MSDHLNIHQKLENLSREANRAKADWDQYVSAPYSRAYEAAHKKFQSVLNEDKKSKQQALDLAFLALSLCGGALLTSAFAATARVALMDGMLNYICRRNLTRVFNTVAFIENSAATQFVFGEVWNILKTRGMASAKRDIETKFNSPAKLLSDEPWRVDSALKEFTEQSKNSVKAMVGHVASNSKLSIEDRGRIYKGLINGPFFAPPDKTPYTDEDKLAKEIEFTMYLNLIIDSDFVQKRKGGRTSIGVSPSAADYPKNIGFGRGYHQKIGYNRIGQTIIDRINVLHKSLYKAESKFIDSGYLGETMNKEIILRAESLLSKIGDRSDIYRQKYAPLIVDKRIQKIA